MIFSVFHNRLSVPPSVFLLVPFPNLLFMFSTLANYLSLHVHFLLTMLNIAEQDIDNFNRTSYVSIIYALCIHIDYYYFNFIMRKLG